MNGMFWRYGAYQHPDNEVNLVRMSHRWKYTKRGEKRSRIIRMEIQGELLVDPSLAQASPLARQVDLSARIDALINAYAVDNLHAGLYLEDGTLTNHFMDPLDVRSVGRVRVVLRDWPKGGDSEYATRRTFRVILEHELFDITSQLVWFEETLLFQGNGGPQYEVAEYVTTAPKRKKVRNFTRTFAMQIGFIVGLEGFPFGFLPGPIFPLIEDLERRKISTGSPRWNGAAYTDYQLHYQYFFTGITPLAGVATIV